MKFVCVSTAALCVALVILSNVGVALGFQCPNITGTDYVMAPGTYYVYASIPTILDAHKKCTKLTLTYVNGTAQANYQFLNTM